MDLIAAQLRRRELLRAVRAFFDQRGFLEVETAQLICANAPEPHIDALPVTLHADEGQQTLPRFLRTSPELALKRLLAHGAERIYEIARVARDADHDAQHRVEFTLLEWYRAGAGYQALMDDCDALLLACADALGQGRVVQGPSGACDLGAGAERLSVTEAFRRHAALELEPFLHGDAAGLARAVVEAGIALPWPAQEGTRPFEDVFFAAFISAVEPRLGIERPTLLCEWPAPMAALARRSPQRPEVALRFELYAAGLELANGFDELTDPVEQRARFQAANRARVDAGQVPYPLDEDFLCDLERMPPSAGIALGIERLLMLLCGERSIETVALPFCW
jgi:lysyl-tRNA synthetase class 2